MNRRSFFKRTLGAIATAALAPIIPSLQPSPMSIWMSDPVPFATGTERIMFMVNMQVVNPRRSKMITNIEV